MADFVLEIPGKQLRRAYLIYVIEVTKDNHSFYYVGQTGDNKYVTARPPFRRLAGHLDEVGKSTQNQLYRHIAAHELGIESASKREAFSEFTKQAVEDYLAHSMVRMHVYKVEPFRPDVQRKEHLEMVRRLRELEQEVIHSFEIAGRRLANKVRPLPVAPCPHPEVLDRVKSDFGL